MGLHQEEAQQNRFNNEGDAISAVGLEKGDVRVPADNNGFISACIMRDPGKRLNHSQNKEATGTLATPDLNVRIQAESGENSTYTQIRNLRTDNPSMEACPYVLEGDYTPPSTPSGSCKSQFVPSFKDVTKKLTFSSFLRNKVDAVKQRLNRWSGDVDCLVEDFWAHMKLGGSMSETVWGKLNLGTKIVAQGGVEKLFKLRFSTGPTEKLLKKAACYLSTSREPVAGLLFISTERVAFCSDRPVSFKSSQGENGSIYYRVAIPLGRIRSVNLFENVNKPSEKYIQIQTIDDHDFWFMAFVSYQKAFKHIQQAVSSH